MHRRTARRDLEQGHRHGYDQLPICIAKTHFKPVEDGGNAGQANPPVLPVESVGVAAGGGYLLALAGDIVTMPRLSHEPAADRIDVSDDGEVLGI